MGEGFGGAGDYDEREDLVHFEVHQNTTTPDVIVELDLAVIVVFMRFITKHLTTAVAPAQGERGRRDHFSVDTSGIG